MQNKNTIEIFNQLKICVIMPTYRNAQFLDDLITSILQYTTNLIVINDGSPDNTAQILNKYSNTITIITHTKNKGKGKALISGFKKAYQQGYQRAITIDSDNQHKPHNLTDFVHAALQYSNALIVGSRSLQGKDINQKSSFANKFSNFWFTVHTWQRLKDTQTGFRLYPVKEIAKMHIFSSKYETELEMLVRCAWLSIPIKSIDIDVYYPPKNQRVSSFRPFRDFTRISILNTIFTFAALFYGYPSMFIHYVANKLKH